MLSSVSYCVMQENFRPTCPARSHSALSQAGPIFSCSPVASSAHRRAMPVHLLDALAPPELQTCRYQLQHSSCALSSPLNALAPPELQSRRYLPQWQHSCSLAARCGARVRDQGRNEREEGHPGAKRAPAAGRSAGAHLRTSAFCHTQAGHRGELHRQDNTAARYAKVRTADFEVQSGLLLLAGQPRCLRLPYYPL